MQVIDILLPTFNGALYLEGLLDSIIKQDYPYWRLIIRDDCSADQTMKIINHYREKYPDKILIIDCNGIRYGILKNYEKLLEISESGLVMLCDQDDIWFPDKISKTLEKMREMEKKYGQNVPLLVHTDLVVVNEKMDVLENSFWKYQNLNPELGKRLSRILVQNIVTGCTAIMNRELIKIAIPFPENAIVHDWWLGITAAAFGHIGYLRESLIYYRQHDGNAIGPRKFNLKYILNTLINQRKLIMTNLQKAQKQADAFNIKYGTQLSLKKMKTIRDYAGIGKKNFILKRWLLIKNGFFKSGLARALGQFLFI